MAYDVMVMASAFRENLKIFRNSFISKTSILRSSSLLSVQLFEQYVTTGQIVERSNSELKKLILSADQKTSSLTLNLQWADTNANAP